MSDSSNCYLNASRQSHNSFRSICLVQLVYYHSQKEWVGVDIPHVVKYCRTPIVITLNQSFLVCRMFVFEISEYLCVAWYKNKVRLVLFLSCFYKGYSFDVLYQKLWTWLHSFSGTWSFWIFSPVFPIVDVLALIVRPPHNTVEVWP